MLLQFLLYVTYVFCLWSSKKYIYYANHLLYYESVLALVVVPAISVAVRKFGRYLRELSHKTQAAAAVAASIAEVCSPY